MFCFRAMAVSEGELAKAEERIAHQESVNQDLINQAEEARQQLQVLSRPLFVFVPLLPC